MTLAPIAELARRHGIALPGGEEGETLATRARPVLTALGVDIGSDEAIALALAVSRHVEPPQLRAPPAGRCYLPDWLVENRAWGISVQLYELRSGRNWGIGDFDDLATLCRIAAGAGADFVGTNPLHALFLSEPNRCSPFSPSSRQFLNPLYIAVDQVPGFVMDEAVADAARLLRATPHIDFVGVAKLKLDVLRSLWTHWRQDEPATGPFSSQAFSAFRALGGEALHGHAVFEALSAEMVAAGFGSGWLDWPETFRSARGAAVLRFVDDRDDEVRFHAWLQWIAHVQLEQAAAAASAAGLRIGLYLDLAVGEAPDGSATWSDPGRSIPGMSIGAPPDMFTIDGQDWGLSPISPLAMRKSGFADFRATNDALMRHAGALRIDHVMALWQLFLVPEAGSPADGAYVRYPVEDLVGILAEQSRLHRTIVIGEDLGHVPPGFRDVMLEAGILSYRIVYFEKAGDAFIASQEYPRLALACLSTHDMPTLTGWWLGDDIGLRLAHGLIDADAAGDQRRERVADRAALIDLLDGEGVLDAPSLSSADPAPDMQTMLPENLAVAAHRFVARTRSVLASVRFADLTGERAQTNLPGTIDAHPNWRVKSSVTLEELPATALFRSITTAMTAERPRS